MSPSALRTTWRFTALLLAFGCSSSSPRGAGEGTAPPPTEAFLWATDLDGALLRWSLDVNDLRRFLRARSPDTRWAIQERGWILAAGPAAAEPSARTAVADLLLLFLEGPGSTTSPLLLATARNVRTGESFHFLSTAAEVIDRIGYGSWDGGGPFLREFEDRELEIWLGDLAFQWLRDLELELDGGRRWIIEPIPPGEEIGPLLDRLEPEVEPGAPRDLLPDPDPAAPGSGLLIARLCRAGVPVFQGCFETFAQFPVLLDGGFDGIEPEEWEEEYPLPMNRAVFEREERESTRVRIWATSEE